MQLNNDVAIRSTYFYTKRIASTSCSVTDVLLDDDGQKLKLDIVGGGLSERNGQTKCPHTRSGWKNHLFFPPV